jgi:hypothetical protein
MGNIVLIKTRKDYEKPGHKYIRRVRQASGKFKYIYKESQKHPAQKVIPVKRTPKIEEVPEIRIPSIEAESRTFEKPVNIKSENKRMMATSDKFFNLSPEDRQSALAQGRDKIKSFAKSLGKMGIKDRQSFADYSKANGRQILADFFGLDDSHFNSETGDKFSNYISTTFSNDGHYVTFNYADKFFFDSINKDLADNKRPKWSMQMRMARGITFDMDTGDMVSLPYEKFFNMDEYIDGNLANLARKMSTQRAIASEKIDGILIQAFYDKHNDKIRFGTRAMLDAEIDERGFIDTAENLTKKTGRYDDIKELLKSGNSMILELVDPRYRVVVGYGKKSALFLHGVRNLEKLSMMNFKETQDLADNFGLARVEGKEFNSFEELVDFQKHTKEDLEGYVLRFEDGSMVKAKTEAYFDKLKGLRALSYKSIGESILNGDDWNVFKYDKIKSEELFDVADKYRADIMKQSDKFNRFLTGFADKIIAASGWEKYGPQEKEQTKQEFGFSYHQGVKDGIIDSNRFKADDFRLAINYLINARMKNDKKDVDAYNKKLMGLTTDALKTGSWMGGKLEELQRSYTEMTLFKDFTGVSLGVAGSNTMGGLGNLVSDKGVVFEMKKEEKDKRKKQSRVP